MSWRRAIVLAVLTVVLGLTVVSAADAVFQGSSLYDNVSPEAQTHGLTERYPSDRYGIDYHISAGVTSTDLGPLGSAPTGVDIDGIPALVMDTFASWTWDLYRFLMGFVITLFTFAFSLDLITGASGALRPVRDAVSHLYDELGSGFLPVAITLVGGWAAWRALVMRDVTRTFGQLFTSMIFVLLAMLLVTQPGWTIGGATRYSNDLSNALLGAINGDDTQSAKTAAADAMFQTLIYDPWVVMQFGGMVHCVDADNKPVKPSSPDCRTRINNKTKYAERWLKAGSPNGKQRTLEYEAIRDGKTPTPQQIDDANMPANAFDGYRLSDADKPAVDIQQQGGATERYGAAVIIFIGGLGAMLLIGGLSIGVILAQVIAILLFAFAAVMLLLAIFPGAGHRAFRSWMERLILAVTRKIWYALILAIVLAIARALTSASQDMGWLMSWGLVATFYWAVFLYRKELISGLTSALPGSTGAERRDRTIGERARNAYYTSKMLRPAAAGVAGAVGGAAGGAKGAAAAAARNTRRGAETGMEMVGDSASNGHAEHMTEAAVITGAAIEDLEREHAANTRRLSDETANRARISELQRREQVAREGVIPEAAGLALTPQEQGELHRRQRRRMDNDAYDGLRDRVNDVERRREDSGGVPFTEEQVADRARVLASRDTNRNGRGTHDTPRPRRTEETDLGDRARRYAETEHPRIFTPDTERDDVVVDPVERPRRFERPSEPRPRIEMPPPPPPPPHGEE